MSARVNMLMLREVLWPSQGDLGWDSRVVVFSIMLVAITIALDVETKLSKRRPKNSPALDSSSREVDSWVEALRFDRRAGALALHLCGFSKPLCPFFFLAENQFFSIFKTNFHDGFLETNQKPTREPASEQQPNLNTHPIPKPNDKPHEPKPKEHKGYVGERDKLEMCTHWAIERLPSCGHEEEGKCRLGYTNHPTHMKNTNPKDILDKYKTIPCKNWKSGKCRFEDKCLFGHE